MNGSRVKLMELREYVSECTGNTYFSGYLGKARVVVLRDDRAECTGKEVARWSVLLEEPEPRADNRTAEAGHSAHVDRTTRSRRGDLPPSSSNTKPGAEPRKRQTAADRRAEQLMRERGIDPDAEMGHDEIPF